MSEENKSIVRRLYEQLDKTRGSVARELFASEYAGHFPVRPGPIDFEGYEQSVRRVYEGFPDLVHVIEDQVSEGDKVLTRMTVHATHTGNFQGALSAGQSIAPTGNRVAMESFVIHRLASGKIAEQWGNSDALGLMQQLGVL